MEQQKRNWQADLKALRDRLGGVPEAKRNWARQQSEELKAVRKALKEGPKTIPAVAAATGLRSDRVTWYVMALKRYGEAAEAGLEGHYFRYEWKEPSR